MSIQVRAVRKIEKEKRVHMEERMGCIEREWEEEG